MPLKQRLQYMEGVDTVRTVQRRGEKNEDGFYINHIFKVYIDFMCSVLESYFTSLPTPHPQISTLSQSVNCLLLIVPKIILGGFTHNFK